MWYYNTEIGHTCWVVGVGDGLSNGENGGRTPGGRFGPGNAGGPGRPRGHRSALARTLDGIGEADAVAIRNRMVNAAKAGDMQAARLILDRLWPSPKGRPVAFDLPHTEGAADIPKTTGAVLDAVSAGDLTAEEGAAVVAIVEAHRKAIEASTLEARIARLEKDMPNK